MTDPLEELEIEITQTGLTSAPPARHSEIDLSALLARVTHDTVARWMVSKDKLDHGPFSGQELVQLIVRGEVLPEHELVNLETHDRSKVADHKVFAEFAEQYRLKKAAQDQASALERTKTVEKASTAFKVLVALGLLAAVGLAAGLFFYSRRGAGKDNANVSEFGARGGAEGDVSASGILGDGKHGRGGRRAGGGGGSGGAPEPHNAAGTTYEQAMSQAVELNMNSEGGERQLSRGDIQGVMDGRMGALMSCGTGGANGRVRIDFAISGSGQVLGTSVRAGSPAFQACIQAKLAQTRFPSFSAPRMGASYTIEVGD